MGWIKAKLDDETHDKLRDTVNNSDQPTHEVAAEIIEWYYNGVPNNE